MWVSSKKHKQEGWILVKLHLQLSRSLLQAAVLPLVTVRLWWNKWLIAYFFFFSFFNCPPLNCYKLHIMSLGLWSYLTPDMAFLWLCFLLNNLKLDWQILRLICVGCCTGSDRKVAVHCQARPPHCIFPSCSLFANLYILICNMLFSHYDNRN